MLFNLEKNVFEINENRVIKDFNIILFILIEKIVEVFIKFK